MRVCGGGVKLKIEMENGSKMGVKCRKHYGKPINTKKLCSFIFIYVYMYIYIV
jgi:hypothetical protein